jgi:TonB family protein
MAVRERVARGETPREAERRARAEFGDVVWVKAAARAAWAGAPDLALASAPPTANDRMKSSFRSWFWAAMIVAALVHTGVFALWPEMAAAVSSIDRMELEVLEIPDIALPAPPEPLPTPAFPVPVDAPLSEDLTIPPTDWESYPVETLPPPPPTRASVSDAPPFTPFTVRPEIVNRAEVERAMQREYPPLLRDASIGGTVDVYFFVDEEGVVRERRLQASSGYPALDAAALAVAGVFRFSPALNRDRRVAVWVALPITFRVQ